MAKASSPKSQEANIELMIFLIDQNLEGYAEILLGAIASKGWLDLLPIQFITFAEIELPPNSTDRVVWRYAQLHNMILLTANRRMKWRDSLEQVMREENNSTSLPVITIANLTRFDERDYREECIERLIEVSMYIDNYLGSRRVFIP
jgi:hypothetical protein